MGSLTSPSYAWSLTFAQAQIAREETFLHPQEAGDSLPSTISDYSPPRTALARPQEALVHVGWTAPPVKRGLAGLFHQPKVAPVALPWAELSRGGVVLGSPTDPDLPFGCLLAGRTLEAGIPAVVLRYDQLSCGESLGAQVDIHFRSRIRGLNLGTKPMQLPKPVRLAQLDIGELLNTPADLADLMATSAGGSPLEESKLRAVYYVLAASVWPAVTLALARMDWERLLTVLGLGFSLQGLGSLALLSHSGPESKLCLAFLGTKLHGDLEEPRTLAIYLTREEAAAAEGKIAGVHELLRYLRWGFTSGALGLGQGLNARSLLDTAWLTCVGMSAPVAKPGLIPTQQWLVTELLVQAQRLRLSLEDPLKRPWLVAIGGHDCLQNSSALHSLEELVGVFEGGACSGLWHDLRIQDLAPGVAVRAAAELATRRSAAYAAVGAVERWSPAWQKLIGAPTSPGDRVGSGRLVWLDLARRAPGSPAAFDGWLSLDPPRAASKPSEDD